MDLGGNNDAENPLTQAANSVAGAARTASISARRAVGMQVPVEVQTCVEDQCVTKCARRFFRLSHFSAMTRPSWLGRAVRTRHRHAIEQASRRWRGGRRDHSARTRRKRCGTSTQRGATAMYLGRSCCVLVPALLHVAVFSVLIARLEQFCAGLVQRTYVPKGRWCVVQVLVVQPVSRQFPVQASLPTVLWFFCGPTVRDALQAAAGAGLGYIDPGRRDGHVPGRRSYWTRPCRPQSGFVAGVVGIVLDIRRALEAHDALRFEPAWCDSFSAWSDCFLPRASAGFYPRRDRGEAER